jgi:hypothetical protein
MSFFDISLDAANRFHSWGWRLAVAGSVLTFLGVLLLMWGTRVRDQDFEEQVAIIHSRAAVSEERAASLEKDAAQLRLDLQRERTFSKDDRPEPVVREITAEQKTCLMGRLREFKSPLIMRFEPDQEAAEYAASLRDVFTKAGVAVNFGSAVRSGFTGTRLAMPDAPAGGQAPPATAGLLSILQYCGIRLDAPIPWQQFPHAAAEPSGRAPGARPEEVWMHVGTRPSGR